MIKNLSLLVILCFFASLSAQSIDIKDIYSSGKFYPQRLTALRSTSGGEHYTLLEVTSGKTTINKYKYLDGSLTSVLFSSENHPELKSISSYSITPDEKHILLATKAQSVFRRSSKALYYVCNIADKSIKPIDLSAIQEPLLSPDGSRVAFCKDNDIYITDLSSGENTRVTNDGKAGEIINGTSDWVYEEEFSIVRMFDWSPSGEFLIYVKFDESKVPLYGMDYYKKDLYPTRQLFKYPKAGEKNSDVSLWSYSLADANNKEIVFDHEDDFYIPRIGFTGVKDEFYFITLNRLQNQLDIFVGDLSSTKPNVLYSEKNAAYINLNDFLTFLPSGEFLFVSDKDGYSHLYRGFRNGSAAKQITKGAWNITNVYTLDSKRSTAYVQTTEQGPQNRTISAVNLKTGIAKRLSCKIGTNNASFSKSGKYYINTFESVDNAPIYTLNNPKDGSVIKTLKQNAELQKIVANTSAPKKEFSTLKVSEDLELCMWMMRPADFDSTRTYPMLMFVYGGPGSQQVLNRWYSAQDMWFAMLTQKGYIVACVDGRGTGGRSADFEKAIYKQMGKLEIEDQIAAAKTLGERSYIDSSRIGIFGWSFGGYMASLAATKGNGVFKAAIAVAPVSSWRFYDTVYTERYLSTPQLNASGYDDNSPLNFAKDLSSKYLLIHGTADDNVHYQNALRMSEELIQANKPFEQMIYPDKAHGISGGNTSLHLFSKMTDFILKNL